MKKAGRVLLAALLLSVLTASAQDFTLKDMQGQEHRLSDYRGKWVLVNFWATWCAPCLEELPELSALHTTHKDKDLVVLGIAMEYPSAQVVRDFLQKHPLPYPIVLGGPESEEQIGPVSGFPTSYLFSPSGKLDSRHAGAISRDDVETYIEGNR